MLRNVLDPPRVAFSKGETRRKKGEEMERNGKGDVEL